MNDMSVVVQQLKKDRERVQKQLQQIDAALSALGSVSSNGAARTMSAAGRRKISLAQKARWAKAKGHAPKPKRTISNRGSQADCRSAESAVGEGEERGIIIKERQQGR